MQETFKTGKMPEKGRLNDSAALFKKKKTKKKKKKKKESPLKGDNFRLANGGKKSDYNQHWKRGGPKNWAHGCQGERDVNRGN